MIKNKENQGFTLIEIAIVVVIFGFILNIFGYGLVIYQKKQKYAETERRMAVIQKAIDEFLEINGRLPCVALDNARPGDANFGIEGDSDPDPAITSCADNILGATRYDPDVAGFIPLIGGFRNTLWVRVGTVPVRALNLPDEYVLDAWGSRFTYAVTNRQASEDPVTGESWYRENAGAINVVDRSGNVNTAGPNRSVIDQVNIPVTNPPSTANFAEYALISHGEDRKGGKTLGSRWGEAIDCPAIGTEDQAENCVHSNINPNIVVSDVRDDIGYDDLVVYKAGTNFGEILPSGAVIAFDQVFSATGNPASDVGPGGTGFQCPDGWAVFEPAEGRLIMGATAPGNPVVRTQITTQGTVLSGNINLRRLGRSLEMGQTTIPVPANTQSVNIPPVITTLFCEKQ